MVGGYLGSFGGVGGHFWGGLGGIWGRFGENGGHVGDVWVIWGFLGVIWREFGVILGGFGVIGGAILALTPPPFPIEAELGAGLRRRGAGLNRALRLRLLAEAANREGKRLRAALPVPPPLPG